MQRKKSTELKDYIILTLAMLIGSIGWTVFLLPNHIGIGGIAGISSVLFWGMNIPVELSYLAFNAFLLSFALKILGWRFCLKTIYAAIVFSLFVSLMRHLTNDQAIIRDEPFMAAVLGGVLLGSSVGLGLSCNGSTGGTDVIAAMIHKYHDISLGKIILCCDISIITSSYLVLHDWQQVLYGYVVLIVSSACVDKVVNMSRRSVQFFIISDKYKEIGSAINTQVPRGCTTINANGFYSGRNIKMLFVLAKQTESAMIFQTIDEIDPAAFVSQSSVIGVYGLGFDKFKVRKKSMT
ncbi:hypothetical protein DEM91_04385 [Prevotella sp. TCVGH]|uniref:YitT family protein n=1 Tax=Prevotella sp. TCVGH TaxID=2182433 RepID=UPI00201E2CE1|nr:YitT family protein [Prevotella sp. TCVGH]MCL6747881.1 hypothetical protein [Prevotella sp. TCVGH]